MGCRKPRGGEHTGRPTPRTSRPTGQAGAWYACITLQDSGSSALRTALQGAPPHPLKGTPGLPICALHTRPPLHYTPRRPCPVAQPQAAICRQAKQTASCETLRCPRLCLGGQAGSLPRWLLQGTRPAEHRRVRRLPTHSGALQASATHPHPERPTGGSAAVRRTQWSREAGQKALRAAASWRNLQYQAHGNTRIHSKTQMHAARAHILTHRQTQQAHQKAECKGQPLSPNATQGGL